MDPPSLYDNWAHLGDEEWDPLDRDYVSPPPGPYDIERSLDLIIHEAIGIPERYGSS